ncbi:MAG: spore coat protein CotJB [Clostridia bacterium]|nr:spore coat protein CotJB [Clostridia bacterium]
MSIQVTGDRHSLLCHIASLGLAVYDTILYLDTNSCPEARAFLEKTKAEYKEAVCRYEEKYGPINLCGHPDEDIHWCWQL